MTNLTPKQINALKIIREFWLKNGYSPTLQEIATELNASSVTALEYIKVLTKKGVISIEKGQRRSIKIIDKDYLPQKLYKHYKGELYEVLHEDATLKLTDADEPPCIIYKSIKDGKIYVRTVSNFHEVIILRPHDLQSAIKRFTEIDPFNPFNQDIPDAKEV
jgi:hypothetical protein